MSNCSNHCAYLRFLEICKDKELSQKDIRSGKRFSYLIKQRWEIANKLNEEGFTQGEIGLALNRDRTTINYYLNRIKQWI